jgi:hypothetical protein
MKDVSLVFPKELTSWENAPTVEDLKQNLRDAEIDSTTYQENVTRWLDNLKITGTAKIAKKDGRSSVAPKVIRKQAEWRYASLSTPFLSTPDVFNVNPQTAGDRKRAQQNALVLNHQFNTKLNKVDFIDNYVRDDVDIGTVIVEVSWVSEEEEVIEEVPQYSFIPAMDPALAEQYMQLLQLRQTNRDAYEDHMNPGLDKALTLFAQTGKLYMAQETGTESVTTMKEVKNHPMVEVCESANIIIDPSCGGKLHKAQFVCKKFKSSLSELRKDGRYKNLEYIMVEESNPLANPDFEESKDIESFSFKDEPRKQFVVHAYWGTWDIHDTGIVVPIVAYWVNDTLIRLEENPFPFKHPPFALVKYMPVRGSVYGEPDGELLEENQQIIGAVTRGMIDLMGRSANSQQGTKQGFLDATNKRKFARGEDYEFNSQGDPRQAVHQHTYPEIPQSAYNMITMQNADAESLSGVKAFASGITGQALGANVGSGRDALDAASKRESGILLRLAQGLKEVGRMFIAMNAVFLSDEEVVRITNEEFITVRRDDLAGSFDLELTISTPEEDAKKAEGLEFLLQTTGNNMDFALRNMILSDIARLRKMPAMAKKIEEYRPEPDPIEQKKAELEILLLQAQIAKEEALTAKHNSEAGANQYRGAKDGSQADLNMAKATTETAKTRNIHSDSDKKDLDYLEQHSGTDLQKEIAKEDNKAANALISQDRKQTPK